MKKIFLLLAITLLTLSTTSCSSGWSCQKRYVNNTKSYNFKKHHVLTNYDKYILNKYKTTKATTKP